MIVELMVLITARIVPQFLNGTCAVVDKRLPKGGATELELSWSLAELEPGWPLARHRPHYSLDDVFTARYHVRDSRTMFIPCDISRRHNYIVDIHLLRSTPSVMFR
jgi:hypothetical protein